MGFALKDKWVWDFWWVRHEGGYHLFYLQADKSIGDPDQRHWKVSIGHATSNDFQQWQVGQDALAPTPLRDGEAEAPDSYATWTGSIIRKGETWYLFYTGIKKSEKGLKQRICLATSPDLWNWEKSSHNPVLEPDGQLYETLNLESWWDQAWRDPWVCYDLASAQYHMFLTARVPKGPYDSRGVIGHATSPDLRQWQLQPAVTPLGLFRQMEVPQVTKIGSLYYLTFSICKDDFSQSYAEQVEHRCFTGMHYMASETLQGPYRLLTDQMLLGDVQESFYAGKIISSLEGNLSFLAFRRADANGGFVGDLTDPMPLQVSTNGELSITRNT